MAVESVPSSDLAVPAQATPKSRRILESVFGLVGEILITGGVVLGLFVVWQLFYTDVLSGRTQTQVLDNISWAEPVRVPAITAGGITAAGVTAPAVEVATIPDSLKVYSAAGAPVIAEPSVTTTFATLHVPRWGHDYVRTISEGTDWARVLNVLGIGHYKGTAMPGAVGNFAIAGHRTTYAKPFADIDTLQVGDSLVVQTEAAWYVYTVTGTAIVNPTDVAVIAPVPDKPGEAPTVASITMTSCTPKFSAAQRYIVWGQLKYWAPTGNGYPSELLEKP
ncbi:class E sortase [Demequina lutea]|uniref:Sortase A n=1 Tax=Demequina lutea TaxID=431489 RepID=A0A7Y9Z8M0_9MICO|nr:class E sortase [Demequina lutea]NYI39978.1 sortase A [Demequina lutea]